MKKLLILGAGGYGRTVADIARQMGVYEKIAFLDDGKTGPDILGTCEEYAMFAGNGTEIYPAFGDNETRMHWLDRLVREDISVPILIHPTAYVSPEASLGAGVVVLPKAVVNTGTTVEAGCIVNLSAIVDHDCILEEGCHLCPGVIVKAANRIPAGAKLESGTVLLNGTYPL